MKLQHAMLHHLALQHPRVRACPPAVNVASLRSFLQMWPGIQLCLLTTKTSRSR